MVATFTLESNKDETEPGRYMKLCKDNLVKKTYPNVPSIALVSIPTGALSAICCRWSKVP